MVVHESCDVVSSPLNSCIILQSQQNEKEDKAKESEGEADFISTTSGRNQWRLSDSMIIPFLVGAVISKLDRNLRYSRNLAIYLGVITGILSSL
jgi:hypothetical protein